MVKRLIALVILTAMLLLSGIQTGVFATDFPDVPITHINYDAIMCLTQMGVVAGYEDGTFNPKKEITRTEFCALMARTLGYNKDTYLVKDVPFRDVPKGYWGSAYISFCYERGLINGMGDGYFAPADKVTVAQIVKMVVCAAGRESEVRSVPSGFWFSGYINVAKIYGLMAENNQDPAENAVRSNAAQLVYNLIQSGLVPETDIPDREDDTTAWEPQEDEEETIVQLPDGDDEDSPEQQKPDNQINTENSKPKDEYDPVLEALKAEYAQKDFTDVKVIVVDAGHNYSGKDIGAQNEELGLSEEIITWQIADRLRGKLEEMGYTVIMTRENVTDSIAPLSQRDSLQARVNLAHDNLADLFISIHCNMGGGTGTETYCYSMDGYAARLAKLAQQNIVEATGLRNRGVKTAGFYVIKNTLMPAILVESAFLDNPEDAEVITSVQGQEEIAQAIADAVAAYDFMEPLTVERALEEEKL